MIDVKMTPELAMSGVRVYMQRVNDALSHDYTPLKSDIKAMRKYAKIAGVDVIMTEIYYKIRNGQAYYKFLNRKG